jgi:hypothetical protein
MPLYRDRHGFAMALRTVASAISGSTVCCENVEHPIRNALRAREGARCLSDPSDYVVDITRRHFGAFCGHWADLARLL